MSLGAWVLIFFQDISNQTCSTSPPRDKTRETPTKKRHGAGYFGTFCYVVPVRASRVPLFPGPAVKLGKKLAVRPQKKCPGGGRADWECWNNGLRQRGQGSLWNGVYWAETSIPEHCTNHLPLSRIQSSEAPRKTLPAPEFFSVISRKHEKVVHSWAKVFERAAGLWGRVKSPPHRAEFPGHQPMIPVP